MSLIEENKGIIYKIANMYGRSKPDRDDLFQDIVLKLWQAIDSYDANYKLSTWMYRIALNTAISFYRKQKVRDNHFLPLMASMVEVGDLRTSKESEQKYILLQQFISELKELDKALMLLYLEEKPYKEIADIMGITESNVGTKIGRLKELLRQRFAMQNR
ncbi:MAG: sigma-70 family RNA polymerase sigma factor [Chitinophagaceae bacterium]